MTVSLYPNPASQNCTIIWGTSTAVATIIMYNNLGQEVYQQKNMLSGHTIDVATLPTGVYHCHILFEDKNIKEVLPLIISE